MTGTEVHVRRVELRLARAPHYSLRDRPLDPDPLEAFASAFAGVRLNRGEDMAVMVDVVPLSPSATRKARGRLKASAESKGKDGKTAGGLGLRTVDFVQQMGEEFSGSRSTGPGPWMTGNGSGRRRSVAEEVGRRGDVVGLAAKLLDPQPMFEFQILVRVQAGSAERANALVPVILAAFEGWKAGKGGNEFRVTGWRLRAGGFMGADSWLRRDWFDFRWRTGYFAPAGKRNWNLVNTSEIEGFLKPPTVRCRAKNVRRSGPFLEATPMDLPEYRHRLGVLPLGRPRHSSKLVGMDMSEFYFGAICGRSRMGKTELMLVQFLHSCLIERERGRPVGALFFDPHVDALARAKPFLTGDGVRERVVGMDLSREGFDHRHVAWNLMSMVGRGTEHVGSRAATICAGFAAASGMSSSATRSTPMLESAVTALLHVAVGLPEDAQPTLFTILRLLQDKEFRDVVVDRLPDHLAGYWTGIFAFFGPESVTPICQFISRMMNNPTIRATFGSPVSTYDPRGAMDEGLIVLLAPPDDEGGVATVVSSLMMQAHIAAARSRKNLLPAERRLMLAFCDETPTWDRVDADGSSALARMYQQLAKFGFRVVAGTQAPGTLTKPTLTAITTNASFLGTAAQSAEGADYFAKNWGGGRDAVDARGASMGLAKYELAMQATTRREGRTDPFYLDGVPVEEMFPEHHHPERVAELEAAINKRFRPHTVRETLKLIDGHDDLILRALRDQSTATGAKPMVPAGVQVVRPIRPVKAMEPLWKDDA